MKKPVESQPSPLLTKLSSYKATPKWSISQATAVKCEDSCDVLGPAAYNPTSCINKTSKFKQISYACSFGTGQRWRQSSTKHKETHAIPGPGTYCPPADYSHAPYESVTNISFGKGGRLFPKFFYKRGEGLPAPSEYDIRGKHRLGGCTFDSRGVFVNTRHGWYYDSAVNSVKMNPGPGQYNPRYPNENHDGKIGFGTGDRPNFYIKEMLHIPGPNSYNIPSKLGGEAHSFTTNKAPIRQTRDSGSFCSQPTQFG